MKTRKISWPMIKSNLDLFENDNEKITYLYQLISNENIIGQDLHPMLSCFHSLKSQEMKLLFAKMIRPLIHTQDENTFLLVRLNASDRAKFTKDQEEFWLHGRSAVEEEEIRAMMQIIEHPELSVRKIPQHDIPLANKNSFRDRLSAIKYVGDIPEYMTCSITGDIMVDPISMSSGIFFDRAAIVAWFKTKEPLEQIACPRTNIPIHRSELCIHTNVVMRYLIDEFVKSKEDLARQFETSIAPKSPGVRNGLFSSSSNQHHSNESKSDKKGETPILSFFSN